MSDSSSMTHGSRIAGIVVCSLVLASAAGCAPKYVGEYDGDATLTLSPIDDIAGVAPTSKFKVHVSVQKDAVTMTGGPLVSCVAPVVRTSRSGLMADLKACAIGTKAKSRTLIGPPADPGSTIAVFTRHREQLEMTSLGSDILQVSATRKK